MLTAYLFTFLLLLIVLSVGAYTVRHYYFTINRLFGVQKHSYLDIDTADWPTVTVLIPAHNEEAVIADCLAALLNVNYPAEKLTIVPVNDRSTDRTKQIIDDFTDKNPLMIMPLHRFIGKSGKAAVLKEGTGLVTSDIIIVFDADYLPARGLIKQLIAPFFDPEVGATMGRVVPHNVGSNLLTRFLDFERSGGYQVDQQARMNLGMVPQYGGTVGGIRVSALESIGGWRDDVFAEDTDLTYRLLLKNWKTIYLNHAECYEEVPESWPIRIRQIVRWARGHNQACYHHFWKLVGTRGLSASEKFDGLALLGVYMLPLVLILGWLLILTLLYFYATPLINLSLALFSLVAFSALGNFAAFFEIAVASYLDGSRERIRLLPFACFGFLVSVFSISRATLNQMIFDRFTKSELRWEKTVRYRQSNTLGQ